MKRRPAKRTRGIFVLLLATGALASYLYVWWTHTPAQQNVPVETHATALSATTHKLITTKYFKTKIPESYRVRTTENPNVPGFVQTILFDASGSGNQVGITTNRLPPEGLSGVSDFGYRLKSPTQYVPYTYANMPTRSTAFKKADGTEISLFITNETRTRYASITVSGIGTTTDRLLELLMIIMKNWVWISH